jgi:hypothetical protein
MTTIQAASPKLSIHFKAEALPRIDPADPRFTIDLGGATIQATVNAKAAKRLAMHQGGAVLQGKLVADRGKLVLTEAGFQLLEPKPAAATVEATT